MEVGFIPKYYATREYYDLKTLVGDRGSTGTLSERPFQAIPSDSDKSTESVEYSRMKDLVLAQPS